MASAQWAVVLRHVHRMFHGGAVAGLSEGQLLDRFVAGGDPLAFEALMARHGPMVLGVCRAVLDDPHDVEDAFQATFLVLVRKAGGLHDRDLLGPWLHGVARKVSLRARSESSRRKARERSGTDPVPAGPSPLDADLRELQALIRDEVDRLPGGERAAVIHCYLEGLTHQEAADRLGWPIGTVKGRLARARDRLRDRLTRRGVALPAVAIATALSRTASAIVPADLVASTTLAAGRMAAGKTLTAGIISAHALALTEGVIRTMLIAKFKLGAAAVTATVALASPGVVAYQFGGMGTAPTSKPKATAAPAAPRPMEKAAMVAFGDIQVNLDGDRDPIGPATPAQIAGQALKTLDELAAGNVKTDPEAFYLWSKRLVDAQVAEAGERRGDRVRAIRSYAERLGKKQAEVIARSWAGQPLLLELADANFRFEEARRWLAEAQAEPVKPTIPNGVMGGGFGGTPGGMGGGFGGGGVTSDLPTNHAYRRPAGDKPSPDEEARNAAILAKLEMLVPMKLDPEVPLKFLIQHVKEATKGPDGKTIPIYVDPLGLQDAEKTLTSPVSLDIVGVPLRTTLRLALKQINLMYEVDEGMLIITNDDPDDGRQKALREPSPNDQRLDAIIGEKLEKRIPMHFPDEVPLDKVLAYIKEATKGAGDESMPIYLDPQGLQDVEKTPASVVSLDLEDVPLRTSLRLLLSQIDLRHEVRSGIVIIDAIKSGPGQPPAAGLRRSPPGTGGGGFQ